MAPTAAARLDQLADEYLVTIFSNLVDHDALFFGCVVAHPQPSQVPFIVPTSQTSDLSNLSLTCKRFTNVAQEIMFRTVTIQQRPGLGSIPLVNSNHFRFISLLVDRPRLRNFVHQLQISLRGYLRFTHVDDLRVLSLQRRLFPVLRQAERAQGGQRDAQADEEAILWWMNGWKLANGGTFTFKLLWLAILLELLPKLQRIRLSTPGQGTLFDWHNALRDARCLLYATPAAPVSPFSNLTYASIHLSNPQASFGILYHLPNLTTVDIRLHPDIRPDSWIGWYDSPPQTKMRHVKHLRWCIDDRFLCTWHVSPDGSSIVSKILSYFVDLRSADVYCSLVAENSTFAWLYMIFRHFATKLSRFRNTLETLRFLADLPPAVYSGPGIPLRFPNLSVFSKMTTLILPQRAFLLLNTPSTSRSLRIPRELLPPALETLSIHYCNANAFKWLGSLFEHGNQILTLRQVEIYFYTSHYPSGINFRKQLQHRAGFRHKARDQNVTIILEMVDERLPLLPLPKAQNRKKLELLT